MHRRLHKCGLNHFFKVSFVLIPQIPHDRDERGVSPHQFAICHLSDFAYSLPIPQIPYALFSGTSLLLVAEWVALVYMLTCEEIRSLTASSYSSKDDFLELVN